MPACSLALAPGRRPTSWPIPWLALLDAEDRERVLADCGGERVSPGELVCRVGRPVTTGSACSTAC
jgi:hypothetical protein